MRKLIIAMAAIGVAIVAQASAVSWSCTGMTDINGTALSSSTLKPFTAVATFYSDAAGTTELAASDGSLNAMGSLTGKWNGASTGTTYYGKLVITDTKGNTIESDIAEFTTNSSATYSINFATGANFANKTNKFASASWQAAPEPTSGLLLLLGVAGLALKRKRA